MSSKGLYYAFTSNPTLNTNAQAPLTGRVFGATAVGCFTASYRGKSLPELP